MKKKPSNTIVNFSAQFGGRDAANQILPHFRALKKAAKDLQLTQFPVPELAFILRVDGEVNQYGLSGPGNVDLDKKSGYLSVDIGVTMSDRLGLENGDSNVFITSLDMCAAFLRRESDKLGISGAIDFDELSTVLRELGERYVRIIAKEV